MNFLSDIYHLKSHDIIYNSLTNISKKDYENFQTLFINPNANTNNFLNSQFNKLINPKNISISKDDSNIKMLNNLFSELLSLFPNNNINNHNINNNSNGNIKEEKKKNIIMDKNEIKNKKSKFLKKKRGRNYSNLRIKKSGTHNRNAQDNMMRKIKNKVMESAYR